MNESPLAYTTMAGLKIELKSEEVVSILSILIV